MSEQQPSIPPSPKPESNSSSAPYQGKPDRHGGRRGHHRGRWRRFRPHREEIRQEPPPESLNLADWMDLAPEVLEARARENGLELKSGISMEQLPRELVRAQAAKLALIMVEGTLELGKGGGGFLRSSEVSYQSRPVDPYVSPPLIKRFALLPGDFVSGLARPPRDRERGPNLLNVDLIWNQPPQRIQGRKAYDELTPLFPQKRLVLENGPASVSMRALDLLAPLGRGQRALIVAPPRAGKTILLQQVAESIEANDPDVTVIVLLLDERPEEVHNMKRVVKGEVVASTFDETVDRHVRVADLVMEKAHRLVENGRHVVVLMDSLTRLARACNALSPSRGKLMSGGVESGALAKPRKFFSAARNTEEGGSLTIVATVLVETGSRMDDMIFEEFKGTGNMEVYLSRDLQERRIYPAIHIEKSGTRREDLLYHPDELIRIQALRRALSEHPPLEAMEELIGQLKATGSNAELLMRLKL